MHIGALSDGVGHPVDWWFVYKLPRGIGPGKHTTGDEFLYCDSEWRSELHLSKLRLHEGKNAVAETLQQLYSGDSHTGYILWNDEIPPTSTIPQPANNHAKGHSKGVLAFNKRTNSGFYLLHSTPRFPGEGQLDLPDNEREYGQTFLCVTLNYATVLKIAEILRIHHEPQVYAFKNLAAESDSPLARLANEDHRCSDPNHPGCIDFKFRSKDWNEFRLFAKNKKWSEPKQGSIKGKDFWNHLVAPALRDRMDVETWRRGEVFGNIDPGTLSVTMDVLGVNLESIGYANYSWPFTKDHAKWGSTEHRPAGLFLRHPGFVVIADINRDESQARRSGGGLAFQHDGIWRALKSVEKVETTIRKAAHKAA
jgi:deoxyribonuclease-2